MLNTKNELKKTIKENNYDDFLVVFNKFMQEYDEKDFFGISSLNNNESDSLFFDICRSKIGGKILPELFNDLRTIKERKEKEIEEKANSRDKLLTKDEQKDLWNEKQYLKEQDIKRVNYYSHALFICSMDNIKPLLQGVEKGLCGINKFTLPSNTILNLLEKYKINNDDVFDVTALFEDISPALKFTKNQSNMVNMGNGVFGVKPIIIFPKGKGYKRYLGGEKENIIDGVEYSSKAFMSIIEIMSCIKKIKKDMKINDFDDAIENLKKTEKNSTVKPGNSENKDTLSVSETIEIIKNLNVLEKQVEDNSIISICNWIVDYVKEAPKNIVELEQERLYNIITTSIEDFKGYITDKDLESIFPKLPLLKKWFEQRSLENMENDLGFDF